MGSCFFIGHRETPDRVYPTLLETSFSPVDAPEGTDARPITPDSSKISTSTVGLPLESRISRPVIFSIFIASTFFKLTQI